MSRGLKKLDGQITFEMCLNTGNYVCQSNDLICGKQSLKLNSAKLIRAAIMQVVRNDEELKPYTVTISDLASLLGVPTSNIYRDIDELTDNIFENPVYIKIEKGKKISWLKIPWVTRCEYHSDMGILIKLNDELKPYLINLKEHYTQYTLDSILSMKSIYAIRIYEMLQQKIMNGVIPRNGVSVEMTLKEIRECCDCEDKYEKFSHLKVRVLETAVNEINLKTLYSVSYDTVKSGRTVSGIIFHVNMAYH